MELSGKVLNEINDLNIKVNEICGYTSNDIKNWFSDLQKNKTVVVGYRTCCGSTDRTQKIFGLWKKVIKILAKNNVFLSEENLSVTNRSPTSAQGFWNEIKYSIKP